MKLIDAEKLKIQEIYDEDLKAYGVVYEEDIEERPEVKAIPIEWIKTWAEKWDYLRYWAYRDIAHAIIEDWEKENDKSNSDNTRLQSGKTDT